MGIKTRSRSCLEFYVSASITYRTYAEVETSIQSKKSFTNNNNTHTVSNAPIFCHSQRTRTCSLINIPWLYMLSDCRVYIRIFIKFTTNVDALAHCVSPCRGFTNKFTRIRSKVCKLLQIYSIELKVLFWILKCMKNIHTHTLTHITCPHSLSA